MHGIGKFKSLLPLGRLQDRKAASEELDDEAQASDANVVVLFLTHTHDPILGAKWINTRSAIASIVI